MKKHLFSLMAIAIAVAALTACSEKGEDNIPVTGVTLSSTTAGLTTGGTLTLTPTVLPANATNKDVSWTSNSATVATVNNGLVTAVAPGTAVITVTTQDGNKTAACTVTVTNPVPQMTMTTQKNDISLRVSGSGTMTINWSGGTSTTYTLSSTWTTCTHTYSGSSTHTITITGNNVTDLDCTGNQLAALDVSNNTALIWLFCSHNQLTVVLNVTNNTKLQTFSCSDNQLSATALNNLFGTLHSNAAIMGKTIYIGNNPGTSTCDRSIATNKGWTVN